MTVRRVLPHLLALAAGVLSAVALVACGSEDRSGLLRSADAQALLEELDTIQARVADGECTALGQDLSQLRGAIVNLPSTVDEALRERLDEGAGNLTDIAPEACTGKTITTEEPEETPTPETDTQTETLETTTTPEPTATPTAVPTPTSTPDTGGVEPIEPEATATPDPGGATGDDDGGFE